MSSSEDPISTSTIAVDNDLLQSSLADVSESERQQNLSYSEKRNDELSSQRELEVSPPLSVSEIAQTPSALTAALASEPYIDMHPLLKQDIKDLLSHDSNQLLAGFSYQQDSQQNGFSVLTFHFFTDYLDSETACQWHICNRTCLSCQIRVHNQHYIDKKVHVDNVYQNCQCHPANASKVPFIERFVRDFFEASEVTTETLRLSRAAFDRDLRLKCFIELLSGKDTRVQYEEMLQSVVDENVLDELIEHEIHDNNERVGKKFKLLKRPRINSSSSNIHYDLHAKHLPPLDHGYLIRFCKYIDYRLRNLNSLCVMCGTRTFEPNDTRVSKPTICEDYQCFSNAMDSKFRNDPLPPSIFSIEIADFLLLLVYEAIKSRRHDLILDPYPKLINPYNTSTTLLDQTGDKQKNIEILTTIIESLMTMGSVTQYEATRISLRSMIELKHPWGFSFFHWLMGTNRYHFSLIPEQHQLRNIDTKWQYFIKHEDIVKNVNFKKLRDEKGSIFAFHGSPRENWHSILRSGLQIGKDGYLLHGAAYGSGIYVSPSLQVSACYSHALYGGPGASQPIPFDDYDRDVQPLERRNWSCVSLCEIIDSPEVYKKHRQDICTIQDPNFICTRFIFFFPTGAIRGNLEVNDKILVSLIRERIHTLHNVAC